MSLEIEGEGLEFSSFHGKRVKLQNRVSNREGRLPHLQSQTLYTLSNLGFWGNNWECVYLCELMLIHELE
jgi:hypothetical protein